METSRSTEREDNGHLGWGIEVCDGDNEMGERAESAFFEMSTTGWETAPKSIGLKRPRRAAASLSHLLKIARKLEQHCEVLCT